MRNKNILILGASSDLGISVTKLLIQKNWNVFAHCNANSNRLKKINSNKIKIIKINFLKKNINNKIKKLKSFKFDAFLNLVGFIDNKSFEKFDIDNLVKTLKVNSIIPLLIIKKIIKPMLKQKWGRIIQTSSIGVKFGGGKNTFNYSMSKHLNEFVPRDYKDWAKKGLLYNVLRIGTTNTKIHKKINKKNISKRVALIPQKRMAETIEVARYIEFLLSERNTYITGQILSISGGE